MVMFVTQALLFFDVQASNITTMALTLSTFPFISLALESVLGLIEVSSLGPNKLVRSVLIVFGYVWSTHLSHIHSRLFTLGLGVEQVGKYTDPNSW
jgi:hypothetical protein